MIGLLRYLTGYVEFCAEGGFAERFLNLCNIHEINLWKIENDGVKVKACTTVGGFKNINSAAEKSGMKITVLKKCGVSFFVKRHKWRCGAVFGVLLTVLFIWFMSGFIWEVEVVEEDGVKIEDFTQTLSDLGVKTGARKSKIDILSVQERLLELYPQLSWVSLNIFGDKAQIEYTPIKKVVDSVDKSPSNIVARKSGEITLVEGYSGTNNIKEGANVVKGGLLISGVTVNADGTEKTVRASGKVFARTENTLRCETKNSFNLPVGVNVQKRYCAEIFGVKIPFGFSPKGDILNSAKTSLEGNSVVLPVGIVCESAVTVENKDIRLNETQAKLVCLKECVAQKRRDFDNVKFENVVFKSSFDGEKYELCVNITCVEDIAEEIPLVVEEN